MRIFQSDSPLMEGLSRISDLVILNMVTLVCCIPVITIGAAMTGMHYVLLKMARNEEGYIVRSYFKAFKENFRQATCMWLFFLIFGAVFAMDVNLTGGAGIAFPPALRLLIIAGGIFIFLMYLYAFPLLARFQNTVFGTLRNAAVLAVAAFPRTIGMVAATFLLPVLVLLVRPLVPLMLLFGLSLPGFLCALLYSPYFKKIESRSAELKPGEDGAHGESAESEPGENEDHCEDA